MLTSIRNKGIRVEDASGNFYLDASIDVNAHVGAPVAPTGNNTVGLAPDGAEILGNLESAEDRVQEGVKTGAVCPSLYTTYGYSGTAPVVGQWVVGTGTEKVKASATFGRCTVLAVDTTAMTVDVTFL